MNNKNPEYAELKILVAEAPNLKHRYEKAYLALLEEQNSNSGKQENGYVYHVRPSIRQSYENCVKEYNDNGQQIFDLCKKLNISINCKTGLPDFNDSIKPYGLTDEEKYKMERWFNFDSPIGLP